MLPEELKILFEEYDEGEYLIFVQSAESGKEIKLNILIEFQNINDKGEKEQKWEVETIGYEKGIISFKYAEFLRICNDDPLLWEFSDNWGELYFSGNIKDPPKLFLDLYTTHKKFFREYEMFDLSYQEALISGNVPFGNGLVAIGPHKLLEEYAICLKNHGLKYSILGNKNSKDPDKLETSSGLNVLLIGDSYLVAKEFLFRKIV